MYLSPHDKCAVPNIFIPNIHITIINAVFLGTRSTNTPRLPAKCEAHAQFSDVFTHWVLMKPTLRQLS